MMIVTTGTCLAQRTLAVAAIDACAAAAPLDNPHAIALLNTADLVEARRRFLHLDV